MPTDIENVRQALSTLTDTLGVAGSTKESTHGEVYPPAGTVRRKWLKRPPPMYVATRER